MKSTYQILNRDSLKTADQSKFQIILPQGLILSFSPPAAAIKPVIDKTPEIKEVLNEIAKLTKEKEQILKSKSGIITNMQFVNGQNSTYKMNFTSQASYVNVL